MHIEQAKAIAAEIIDLYQHHGGAEYAGEKVTQLEHMVQAAELAEKQGHDEEVILAAFLHDIGHICVSAQGDNEMGGYGIKDHEEVGGDYLLEKGFSKRLIHLVEAHVEAKRYLTWKSQAYYDQLSEASKRTLEYQGGRMGDDEARAFEQHPLFNLIIDMRYWDEEAKIEGLPVPDLSKYEQMMARHLARD
jgi:2-amino-1-hydroxyethylphosphonate dioxygenase (glycine-forming)